MKKILPLFAIVSVLFFGCQKEDTPPDKVCELNEANVVGTYKLISVSYKANASTPSVDEFATYEACAKDDLILVNADNVIVFSDAGISCTPPANSVSNWSLSGKNFLLDDDLLVIDKFTCTEITGTVAGDTPGEITTITLKRQ